MKALALVTSGYLLGLMVAAWVTYAMWYKQDMVWRKNWLPKWGYIITSAAAVGLGVILAIFASGGQ